MRRTVKHTRRPAGRLRRLYVSLAAVTLLALALAPSALATYGRGLYGATNDKVVTNFGFIIIIFFPLLAFVLSMIQWRLDKRKEARKAAEKARIGDVHWHGGW